MATEAQIAANRANAQKSTGPRTEAGKSAVARNAVKFGLYARHDQPNPRHRQQDEALRDSLLTDLAPDSALEESLAAEILRATRRIDRCAEAEMTLINELDLDVVVDDRLLCVDRARVAAERSRDRAITHLRRLQTERVWRAEFLARQSGPSASGLAEHREIFASLSPERRHQLRSGGPDYKSTENFLRCEMARMDYEQAKRRLEETFPSELHQLASNAAPGPEITKQSQFSTPDLACSAKRAA
jgi:hypothetical protein